MSQLTLKTKIIIIILIMKNNSVSSQICFYVFQVQHYGLIIHYTCGQESMPEAILPHELRNSGMSPLILTNYRCSIQSILTGCMVSWYIICSVTQLQRLVKTAQSIKGHELCSIKDIYSDWCHRTARSI